MIELSRFFREPVRRFRVVSIGIFQENIFYDENFDVRRKFPNPCQSFIFHASGENAASNGNQSRITQRCSAELDARSTKENTQNYVLFCVLFFHVCVREWVWLVLVSDLCFMDELHAKHKRVQQVDRGGREAAKEQLIYAISTSFRNERVSGR